MPQVVIKLSGNNCAISKAFLLSNKLQPVIHILLMSLLIALSKTSFKSFSNDS